MNKAAFKALYRSHYQPVLLLCRRLLSDTAEAEDATQEVFMRAYRRFDRYDPAQPFGAWVNTIASNYCIDILRRRKRLGALLVVTDDEPLDELAVDPAEGPAAGLISNFEAQAVTQAVNRLDDKYRIPIVLAYFAEASYEEIAHTLGVSRNHVGVLLLRGKQQLRRVLQEQQTTGASS